MRNTDFECRAVSKSYEGGHRALAEVSLTISSGNHTAIIGPSGCGKSTLLRLLAGLDAPSSGQVWLDGALVSEANKVLLPPYRRRIGMVFQDLALWPNLSVLENVLVGISGKKYSRRESQAQAREALSLCKVEVLADKRPATISGGEQQRVALARALAVKPDFLFLDEPFSGLDLITKMELLKEVSLLIEKHRITLVLVTHDPIEATELCRTAVVMDKGSITESGVLKDLLSHPRSEMLRVFREHVLRK